MLECQICGHKACEHIAAMVDEHVEQLVKLRNILETATKLAGEKLTGKELTEEHVRRVADMILREESMITWMTLDERAAMQLDIDYRDQCIQELQAELEEERKKND